MHLLEPVDDTTIRDTWKKSKAMKSEKKEKREELIQRKGRTSQRLPCETFEELSHRHKVQLIGTIEHYTLYGERFGEILGGFRFARSGGASWRTAEFQVQRPS